ncbi:MAG: ATP-binding protein, partial [candidate division Zixibacteria bacterium]|nr:ATP-binding protein [candidate division Zixibacteria bacterium]
SITVLDSGCGIPEKDINAIFTPFFSSRPSGTGLGLPLARKIIDQHNGSLSVTSTEGSGACFCLTLPFEAAPAGTAPARNSDLLHTQKTLG